MAKVHISSEKTPAHVFNKCDGIKSTEDVFAFAEVMNFSTVCGSNGAMTSKDVPSNERSETVNG